MIKSLRKKHLQIWTMWAILLPVGIIIAWRGIPGKVTQELLQKENLSKGKVIRTMETEKYKISILWDSILGNKIVPVELVNKKVSTTPALLLYHLVDSKTDNIDKQELLGRIGGKSTQYFFMRFDYDITGWAPSYYANKFIFIFYDAIKKQKIDSINLWQ